jgi:PAS domain S-box-containing protein
MSFFRYKKQFFMMQAFGLFMGVIFPLFARIFVEYKPEIANAFYYFWAGCLIAGSAVGWVCYYIFYRPQSALEVRTREVLAGKERIELLMENMEEGIMVIDRDYKITEINPRIVERAKLSKEEIIGKCCYKISHGRDEPCEPPDDVCPLQEVFKTGEPFTVTHRHFDSESNISYVELVATPIEDMEGKVAQVMEVSRDITERVESHQKIEKYARELERSNHLKGLFTDIMRHDLLNPTGIIRNIVEIMEDDEKMKGSQEMAVIKRNIEKLEDIIQNATQYAKLESPEGLEKKRLKLTDIISSLIGDVSMYAEEKKISIDFVPEDAYEIKANSVIESVFLNLLTNAIKYSPEETNVKIAISDEGDNLMVSVKDQGEGVPDKFKEAIFDRFTRKDKLGVRGSGLGLAIVKRIVELHGGRVWVEDNPGGGSMFIVTLPKEAEEKREEIV